MKQNRAFFAGSWLRVAFQSTSGGAASTGQLCWLRDHSLPANCWFSSREHLHSAAYYSTDGPNPGKQSKAGGHRNRPVDIRASISMHRARIIRSSHTLALSGVAPPRHASRCSIRQHSLPVHRQLWVRRGDEHRATSCARRTIGKHTWLANLIAKWHRSYSTLAVVQALYGFIRRSAY